MTQTTTSKFLYWMSETELDGQRSAIADAGIELRSVKKTPCEVLKASGRRALFAPPSIWSLLCTRQGSWYRTSERAGKVLIVTEMRLPESCEPYLDASISASEFQPDALPSNGDLLHLIDSDAYRERRPDEWELPGVKDSVMFKVLFTLTGFWGWGDNLKSHWVHHRANHANFLAKRFTTDVDGEAVPYSVTTNDGVCSSCVEFFNVVGTNDRKLVRACPGSITFANLERERYYDVAPVRLRRSRDAEPLAT